MWRKIVFLTIVILTLINTVPHQLTSISHALYQVWLVGLVSLLYLFDLFEIELPIHPLSPIAFCLSLYFVVGQILDYLRHHSQVSEDRVANYSTKVL